MKTFKTFGLVLLYVGIQIMALALAYPFIHAGLQSAESSPNSVTSIIPLIIVIVLVPIFIILLAKNAPTSLSGLRVLMIAVICMSLVITLQAAFYMLLPTPYVFNSGMALDFSVPLALLVACMSFLFLLMEPQWYVVDAVGFLAGGSLTAILGIFLGILPVLVFLIVLMAYDAIAVYGTRHMISLADVVSDMKLPIMMVMPSEASFDYTQSGSLKDHMETVKEHPEEREALFMGLGDAVIPGILVVSSFVFLPGTIQYFGIGANLLVAFGAMIGSLVGYVFLMRLVAGGNPQAGLPFLNGGAIAGYVISYFFLFHSLSMGISLP
jgi:presenilin-like A22 family membrane protease